MSGQLSPSTTAACTNGLAQRWKAVVVCLVLAAMTFAVFGRTLRHEFIDFDDNEYVFENPVVAQGLTFKGIAWAFSCHASNWHPLTWISHMLDCQLYGLHPGGHHLTNVLLHAATAVALFLVLRQMTGAFWRSAFVAAVFAIHPLRVESVAWVAERKDVLSGLFFMLTIGAYVRYARRPWSPVRYGLVMLLFAMGLMCKPMLVTLPVVLLLLDYWPLQRVETRKFSGLLMEKLPLLALSAAGCVLTVLAQHSAMKSTESLSLLYRFDNALVSCMVYLGQMVWPAGLAVFYPCPDNGLLPWEVALAGALLAGLSAFALWQRRKQPWLLAGWFWYLVMLLPVVGIIQVGEHSHADRYTYLPQIGIYLAVTWLLGEWRVSRMVLAGLMTTVLVVLSVCAWKQTAYWIDNKTLWNHALACTTRNITACVNLGHDLLQKGGANEAITLFQQALQINPDFPEAHNELGLALRQTGKTDEAITHFEHALQTRPNFAQARLNLGSLLRQEGKVDEAIAQFQTALDINPDYAEANYDLGNALFQTGKLDEAIARFQKAAEINPGFAAAHYNLGAALCQEGRGEEAIAHFQKALQIQPGDAKVQNNLAWLLATCPQPSLRDGKTAVELAQQANALTGGENATILHSLAAALAETGRFSEAVQTAQHALRLAEAHSNTNLAGQLQVEMKLYLAGRPFHIPAQAH